MSARKNSDQGDVKRVCNKNLTNLCIFTVSGCQIIDVFVGSEKAKVVNGVFHFLLLPYSKE